MRLFTESEVRRQLRIAEDYIEAFERWGFDVDAFVDSKGVFVKVRWKPEGEGWQRIR